MEKKWIFFSILIAMLATTFVGTQALASQTDTAVVVYPEDVIDHTVDDEDLFGEDPDDKKFQDKNQKLNKNAVKPLDRVPSYWVPSLRKFDFEPTFVPFDERVGTSS